MRIHDRGAAALVALAGLLLAAGLAACSGPQAHRPAANRGHPAGAPEGGAASSYRPPDSTLLATADGTIPKFAAPGGPQNGQVPGTWHDAPSTLPVVAQQQDWLKVRLAQRPNEATAWVRAQDVTLSTTPYAIELNLATTHLSLYRSAQKVFSAPVGIGTRQFPTPTGTYFVAFLAEPPAPAYGAFVMVTSAHSDGISDWEKSGDGMVGLHGPLNSDAQIGTTGVRISHGCIRLHENDLLRLRDVPAGTPVTIVSS